MHSDTLRGIGRLVGILALALPLTALVGAGDVDSEWKKTGADAGLRQVFARAAHPQTAAPVWWQQQELTSSDGGESDSFGVSVSVSGDTAVVGASGKSGRQGAAYVFVQSRGTWSLQQELTASDGASGDLFGYSVSLSGDTAVIGAPLKTVNGQQQQGAAYVFIRSGGVWTQQQDLTASDGAAYDNFGYSASVSGATAMIGASGRTLGRGAAYSFTESGGAWTQQQELTASDSQLGDSFGASVSVSGGTALIGAIDGNSSRGSAYVFAQGGGGWTQQQELTVLNGFAGASFGCSVSVDGSTAIVGAGPRFEQSQTMTQGAAYVFMQSGGVWTERQELIASDGKLGDSFGVAVALSGDIAVIGAFGKNGYQGAAYVFASNGGTWSQQQELMASDGAASDGFGFAVSVSGETPMVGAYSHAVNGNRGQGSAYVFMIGESNPQTISFGALSNKVFGAAPFAITATASSGLPVSFASLTTSVCTVSGSLVTLVGTGTCTIQATQAGNADYAAATPVNQSFQVMPESQTIAFGALANQVLGAAPFTVAATASSGLPVSFASLTTSVCTVSGSLVTVVAAGTCTIQATQAGNADYAAATPVSQSFIVTALAITGIGVSGGGANIAQNTWVSIYGTNLAPASVGVGMTWSSAPSFASGEMPTALDGVSVTVNAKPAYIYFVSPTQVNVLTPLDATIGPVAVVVNNGTTITAAFTANMQAAAPGFLRFDGVHIAAEHANYSLLGPAAMSVPGYTFTPAKPGETILLFGDGFGLPVTTLTAGSDVQSGALATLPQVTIGGTAATVAWAGLVSPGLYQINVTVPPTAASGDNQVIATYDGSSSPTGAMIAVAQ